MDRCPSHEHSFFIEYEFRPSLTRLSSSAFTNSFADWTRTKSSNVGDVGSVLSALVTDYVGVLVCLTSAMVLVVMSPALTPHSVTRVGSLSSSMYSLETTSR